MRIGGPQSSLRIRNEQGSESKSEAKAKAGRKMSPKNVASLLKSRCALTNELETVRAHIFGMHLPAFSGRVENDKLGKSWKGYLVKCWPRDKATTSSW